MKNAHINRFGKSLLFTAVIAFLSFGPVINAKAQGGKDDTIAIKYLGAVGNNPIFLVEFDNLDEDDILVTLKDSDGNQLYAERFKDKKFSKKFQLQRTEHDMQIVLTLSGKKGRISQQYQINRNTRMVEDVTVTKMR